MRNSRRLRIVGLLFSLIFLGVMFTAGYCKCAADGTCVWVDDRSDAVGCLYGVEPGIDMSCRGSGGGGGAPPPTAVPTATSTPVPTPTATPAPFTIFKSGTNEMHHGGGKYYGSVTVTGYARWSDGSVRVFDLNSGRTRGQEVCVGTAVQTDWDYFGQIGAPVSPATVPGSGGYATGLFDCPLGHSLWVDNWYWWRNAANPTIDPMEIKPPPDRWIDAGYTHCAELVPVAGGGDPLHLCSAFPE